MLEGSSLIKQAQIEKIDTIYFGGGTPSLMPTKILSVSLSYSTLGNISWFIYIYAILPLGFDRIFEMQNQSGQSVGNNTGSQSIQKSVS